MTEQGKDALNDLETLLGKILFAIREHNVMTVIACSIIMLDMALKDALLLGLGTPKENLSIARKFAAQVSKSGKLASLDSALK